jgi:hypothetical protein
MIVNRIGYLKKEQVLEMLQKGEHFSLYSTHKNTVVLIKNSPYALSFAKMQLCYPKKDRLPYKTVEGKKIAYVTRFFNSASDSIELIDFEKWNGGNQVMAYEEFNCFKHC